MGRDINLGVQELYELFVMDEALLFCFAFCVFLGIMNED